MTETFIKRADKTGVTLIELLIAVSITLIIGASIVAALYSGRSAWHAGDDIVKRHRNVRAAFDFMARDLQEAYIFPFEDVSRVWADFYYDGQTLEFTAITGFPEDGFALRRVAYRLYEDDDGNFIIQRADTEYDSQPGEDDFDGLAWNITEDGLGFTFAYRGDTGDWADPPAEEWDFLDGEDFEKGRLPERVEISITPEGFEEPVRTVVKMPLSDLRPYMEDL